MRIAVLSDIHGNGIALDYAIRDLKSMDINKLIILGDVAVKGPMPSEVLEILQDDDLKILAWIKGNTDLWLEEISEDWNSSAANEKRMYQYYKYAKENLSEQQIAFIRELPLEYSFSINSYKILCVHGTPQSICKAIDGSDSEDDIKKAVCGVREQVILCGHSHTSFIGEVDGKKIFNAGSVGNSVDGDNRISYGILDFSKGEIELINRRISYPFHKIIDIAIEREFPLLDEYKRIILTASM